MRKRLVTLVKVVVTASLVSWLFSQLDPTETLSLLQRVHPSYLLLAFALTLVMTGMVALRWQLLLGVLHIRLPFKEICAIAFISNFFAYFLPSSMGGEAVKIYYGIKLTERRVELIFSNLLDRCIGVVALISVPLVVILISRPTGRLQEAVGFVYTAVSALLLLTIALGLAVKGSPWVIRSKKPTNRLGALLQGLSSFLYLYAEQKGILLQTFGIAVASHLLNIAIYYIFGASLGEENRLLDFFYFVPMVTLVTLLPVSLGGLGVREWSFVYLFTELGMPRQTALSISLLNLLVKIGASLIGAALYLAKGRSRRHRLT